MSELFYGCGDIKKIRAEERRREVEKAIRNIEVENMKVALALRIKRIRNEK